MDIEEENTELPSGGQKNDKDTEGVRNAETPDELLMDYDQLPSGETEANQHNTAVTVGLMGGQPKDDEGGLDVSQYTGPHSKASSQFNDPQAPFHTGPGNNESNENEKEVN